MLGTILVHVVMLSLLTFIVLTLSNAPTYLDGRRYTTEEEYWGLDRGDPPS